MEPVQAGAIYCLQRERRAVYHREYQRVVRSERRRNCIYCGSFIDGGRGGYCQKQVCLQARKEPRS